jgi:uncharacterized protein (TIGR03435 family)
MLIRGTLLLVFGAAVSAPLAQTSQPASLRAPGPQTTPGTQAQVEQSRQVPPAFEVVSVRPEDPDGMAHMVKMSFSEDGYQAENATVAMLIRDAYGIEDKQIVGAPDWARSVRFEIDARIDTASADQLGKMDAAGRRLAHQEMLQSLLTDRFMLTFHRESKELPIYTLVVAKNGSKLHEAKPGDDYANGLRTVTGQPVVPHMLYMRLGGGRISGQGVPLEYLVQQLSSQFGLPVQDKTGLTGSYDFTLEWTPEKLRLPLVDGPGNSTEQNQLEAEPAPTGASLSTALEEQLGLRLEIQKGPVEMLVIDRVERPTEN